MDKKGFTLMELVVVVSIIGILTTLAIVALHSARLRACSEGNKETCVSLEMTPSEAQEDLNERNDGEEYTDPDFLERLMADIDSLKDQQKQEEAEEQAEDQLSLDSWEVGTQVSLGKNLYEVTRFKERVSEIVIELDKIN